MSPQPVSRHTVRAVIFDMDGVIIDSGQVIERAWSQAAERRGVFITAEQARHSIHGRTGAQTVKALFPTRSAEEHLAIWREVDSIEEVAAYGAIAGVQTFLRSLHDSGVAMALVTSGWTRKVDNVLSALGLSDIFPLRITRDQVERGKPHPEPYLTACRELGIRPDRALVFEDSHSGVASAVSAGTVCVGVGDPALRALGAVDVVPDFTSLTVTADLATTELGGLAGSIQVLKPEAGLDV